MIEEIGKLSKSLRKLQELMNIEQMQIVVNHIEDIVESDMQKVKSLPPANLHFQISAKVKFQI